MKPTTIKIKKGSPREEKAFTNSIQTQEKNLNIITETRCKYFDDCSNPCIKYLFASCPYGLTALERLVSVPKSILSKGGELCH